MSDGMPRIAVKNPRSRWDTPLQVDIDGQCRRIELINFNQLNLIKKLITVISIGESPIKNS